MPPSFEPRESKGSTGPIISIVIILLLMIAGAIYFWYSWRERKAVLSVPPITIESTTTVQ